MSGHEETDGAVIPVEIVHLHVYDIGRSVDLKKAASLIPANPDLGLAKRRDTPASLTLPKPLVVKLNSDECDAACFDRFSARAKIYDDGALTLVVRYRTTSTFAGLPALADLRVGDAADSLSVSTFAERSFATVCDAIRPAVSGGTEQRASDRETYTAFCLLECPGGDPAAFLARNGDVAASLLAGEEPGRLHRTQIDQILDKPFSYTRDDVAIFDMDRCLIIDPSGDYEDVIIMAEHANYRLLELRVLDGLLDKWLDEAEHDLRSLYLSGGKRRMDARFLRLKLARIQSLRFDALFTLENLDNSSKIIGDYFLGLVYNRLCAIFNTEEWKVSVGRRLGALQDLYEMLKTDTGERRLLTLEVVFIVVCVIFPILQILQVMVAG